MASKIFSIGRVFGYRLTADPTALIASAVLWLSLALLGRFLLGFSWQDAVFGGLACVVLHWASEIWHQAGHASAARSSGYPMESVHMWYVFGFSRYPGDEPDLPDEIHLQRAIGGPKYSLLLTGVAAVLFFAISRIAPAGVVFWVAAFFALDNLLFFTLGALLPLGFTDGSSILNHWPRP